MNNAKSNKDTGWSWVPSLYFYQGIPYSIVMVTSGLIYQTMGISLASFAFWTSLLYLPWALKPLWSPYVEVVSTKRNWVVITQVLMALGFGILGFILQSTVFYWASLVLFFIMAVLSASHDIAADGFYMLALNTNRQSFFVGIRSTFYRFAMLTALGLLPLMAGYIQENTGRGASAFTVEANDLGDKNQLTESDLNQSGLVVKPFKLIIPLAKGDSIQHPSVAINLLEQPALGEEVVVNISQKAGSKDIELKNNSQSHLVFTDQNWDVPQLVELKVNKNLKTSCETIFLVSAGNVPVSWLYTFLGLAVVLLLFSVYHYYVLPRIIEEKKISKVGMLVYKEVFASFFSKEGVIPAILFFVLYRFGESQLVKVATPFLVDSQQNGGIGMTSSQYGMAYGTIGMIGLTLGGILGGFFASKYGLKKLIWLMAFFMNVPNLGYVLLSFYQPLPTDWSVYAMIATEQFGYGFGFTAYILYMLYYVGESKFKTAEFAIGTSIMALGMMLPGMISGWMKELIGYEYFFIYVFICTIPGMIVIKYLKLDKSFGKKSKS